MEYNALCFLSPEGQTPFPARYPDLRLKQPRLPIVIDSGLLRSLFPLQLRDSAGLSPGFPNQKRK